MKSKLLKNVKSGWFIGGIAFILGVLLILGVRFATYQPEEEVHYHANFAVYINGQREEFASPAYYVDLEESCATNQQISPHERAHMHDNVNNVAHVEDEAVTWGHFFQNIGWAVDGQFIKTQDRLLLADEQNNVTFVLNGKKVDGVNRLVIGDEDKLLVDYGSTSEQDIQNQYKAIPASAHKYDITPDPASCGAGHTEPTFKDRLNHLF